MSGMNEYLAQYYGTGNGATSSQVESEDVEKQAQVELFLKLAGENNIDLENLPESEVAALWSNFEKNASAQTKVAEEEKKDEEKKEKAKEEHEEKKEAAAKVAEADYLGRVMAHSYVDELKKIAAASGGEQTTEETETKEAAMPDFLRKGLDAAKSGGGKAVDKAKNMAGAAGLGAGLAGQKAKYHAGEAAKKGIEVAKKHPGATHAAAGAAGAAAGAGGMHAAKKEKKASALDELACASALQKVAAANFDVDEAATRLNAVLQLPASEETKVAFVSDLDQAIDVRSLELLELAGYPVTWNQ